MKRLICYPDGTIAQDRLCMTMPCLTIYRDGRKEKGNLCINIGHVIAAALGRAN